MSEENRPVDGADPPILGTWRRLYVTVLLELVALIALFYWFSKAFR